MQWRDRRYLGHQVVALAHSEQGCALVGLCLSMCEVGVGAGGVLGRIRRVYGAVRAVV